VGDLGLNLGPTLSPKWNTGVAPASLHRRTEAHGRRRDQPDLITTRSRGPLQYSQANTSGRGLPHGQCSVGSIDDGLFADHCPIWHASGWMALCLEAIVFILPPGDAIAISITMEVPTAAAQRERWRDRQRQRGGDNNGTEQCEPKLFHQHAPLW
jgi:hypothetical protein